MFKLEIKLLYNEEGLLWTETELLVFKIILPWTKLDIVGPKLVSNGLIFSDDIRVNILLAIFLL